MGTEMNLITTVIGFGMSATFIVFVCARLLCVRFRRDDDPRLFLEFHSGMDVEQPEHRDAGGLEPVMVAAIPTMKFDRKAFSSFDDAQCSICLGEYEEKEVLRIMPKCGHSFHVACIDVWLRKKSTCPVCRLSLHNTLEPKIERLATVYAEHTLEEPEISVGVMVDHDHIGGPQLRR
ncbi:hypothetical protein MLD38_036421 [Melastoma candidum]|uniref:Uncharacterized protein n=1 Tax=Melastoma candidum TaxID=119954 RepID=A0ACB9LJL5_9MYRT|nr:hypothetical protein MLD38_036421 [Melastoma candidum]